MDLHLKNKVVLITGAAGKKGSIGHTLLQHLVEEGAIPAVIDRNERGFGYIKEIQKRGTDALFCQADVTDPYQVEKAVERIASHYGRIDVVLNNVGVNDGVNLDASYDEFIGFPKTESSQLFPDGKIRPAPVKKIQRQYFKYWL